MGISAVVARSTLADANEARDWRIYFELAQRLITKARALYVDEDFGVELANTVYALDATTIDLCLSMFPWAPFRSTKAAVKLHTLLDLRGSIPTFIHISDGKRQIGRTDHLGAPICSRQPGAQLLTRCRDGIPGLATRRQKMGTTRNPFKFWEIVADLSQPLTG